MTEGRLQPLTQTIANHGLLSAAADRLIRAIRGDASFEITNKTFVAARFGNFDRLLSGFDSVVESAGLGVSGGQGAEHDRVRVTGATRDVFRKLN